MTTYDAGPTALDIVVSPADQSVTFTFTGAPNVAGTWEFAVRDAYSADTIRYAPTVVTTNAATGVIVVPFTETALLALIASGYDTYQGRYTMERNTRPVFAGTFTVDQKATR